MIEFAWFALLCRTIRPSRPVSANLRIGGLATLLVLILLVSETAGAAPPGVTRIPMTLKQYMALDGPAPTETLAYDGADSQVVEVFIPPGAGPFPVAVLIHGGCWSLEYGGLRQMHDLAGGLLAEGIAVWNVEYRRVDEPGGGYPGTYQDVAHAIDLLAAQATRLHLDADRVVAIGHSAGGQLVQWLAGRSRIPRDSPLYQERFLPIHEVIGLGSLADLAAQRQRLHSTCGREQEELTGRATADRPDVLADTNPLVLLPNGSHTVLVHGSRDHQVPPSVGRAAVRRIRASGDRAELLLLPGAGHFDEVAFHRPAWQLILPRVRQALGMPAKPGSDCLLRDLMPDFWRQLDAAEPAAVLRAGLIAGHPELYNPDFVDLPGDADWEARVAREQDYLARHRAEVDLTWRFLQTEVPQRMRAFAASVGDFRCDFPVFIAPSFGRMNGAAASVGGSDEVLFAPDVIPRFNALPLDIRILIDHETFHIYHHQVSPSFGAGTEAVPTLLMALWSEGLATYASGQSNPSASLDEILMQPGIPQGAQAHLAVIASELRAHLDQKDAPTFRHYFVAGQQPTGYPPRAGYYLGLELARELARDHGLKELAHLSEVQVRAAVLELLAAWSTNPAPE